MLPWEVDSSEPMITPGGMLAYYRSLSGDDNPDLTLPDLLVATFQGLAFTRMAERLGDPDPPRWPTPTLWPLARGCIDGRSLAATRLPVGAPAATLALEVMMAAGVRTALVVGSAGSLQPDLPLGSLVIPTEALRHEGTSHHYLPSEERTGASRDLVDALVSTALRRGLPPPALGVTWTTDAPYRECSHTIARLRTEGVLVVEMEAAALFAVANLRGARVALTVAVSDHLQEPWTPGFHTLAYRRALLAAVDLCLETASRLPASDG